MSDFEKFNYYKNKDHLNQIQKSMDTISDVENKLIVMYNDNNKELLHIKKILVESISNYHEITKKYRIDI